MTIKRGARKTGFTVLDNAVFNSNLSFRAMGLLAYLLSKPDHWEVSVQQLVNMSGKSSRPDGRDSVYAIIDELMGAGFMKREQRRNGGKMNGFDYEVHDTPQHFVVTPSTALPETVAPQTDLPDTAEPTQVNTDSKENTEGEVKTESLPATPVAGGDLVMQVEISGVMCSLPADKRYPKPGSEYHIEWSAYAVCYHWLHKDWPEFNPVSMGLIKNILKVVPRQEFPSVVGAFMRSKEQFIVSRGHNLKDLAGAPQKYLTIARTGKQITSTQARHEDRTAAVRNKADEAYEQALAMQGGIHAES